RLHVPAGPEVRRSCAPLADVGDLVDLEVDACLELVVAKCLDPLGERELARHARLVQLAKDRDVTERIPGEGAVPDAWELVDGDAADGFVSAELQNLVALVLIPVAPDGDPAGAVDIAVAYREKMLVLDEAAAGGQRGQDGLDVLFPVVPTEDGVDLGLVVVELGRPAERCVADELGEVGLRPNRRAGHARQAGRRARPAYHTVEGRGRADEGDLSLVVGVHGEVELAGELVRILAADEAA